MSLLFSVKILILSELTQVRSYISRSSLSCTPARRAGLARLSRAGSWAAGFLISLGRWQLRLVLPQLIVWRGPHSEIRKRFNLQDMPFKGRYKKGILRGAISAYLANRYRTEFMTDSYWWEWINQCKYKCVPRRQILPLFLFEIRHTCLSLWFHLSKQTWTSNRATWEFHLLLAPVRISYYVSKRFLS